MDFDSPDVEKEFPGLYAAEGGSKGSKKDEKPECKQNLLKKFCCIIFFSLFKFLMSN